MRNLFVLLFFTGIIFGCGVDDHDSTSDLNNVRDKNDNLMGMQLVGEDKYRLVICDKSVKVPTEAFLNNPKYCKNPLLTSKGQEFLFSNVPTKEDRESPIEPPSFGLWVKSAASLAVGGATVGAISCNFPPVIGNIFCGVVGGAGGFLVGFVGFPIINKQVQKDRIATAEKWEDIFTPINRAVDPKTMSTLNFKVAVEVLVKLLNPVEGRANGVSIVANPAALELLK